MKRTVSALWRTIVFAAFVPALTLSLAACEPENGGEEDGTEDTTSEIAVTGLVDKFGCTYADISGYANLNLLPAGSGNPVIGVEVVEAKAETNENAVQATAGSLIGNIFTVSFSNLSPATEYKYRSFVTYGGITYYGTKYNSFTTKEVVGITSTGEASEIKIKSAVLSASVLTEGVNARDYVSVGLAWSTNKEAISTDGNFESLKSSVQNVENGVFSATLSGLSGSSTYYYASFTLIGDIYVFSSVKSFTTEDIPESAVDLGLSVLWASCNVGAESPEEYGGYYAWGETEEKTVYSWSTYKWCDGSYDSHTKYCVESYYGMVDYKTSLEPEDDVARVKWGGNWRMPTIDEFNELRDNCAWKRTFVNGIDGQLVTGPNGNSIFFPAAGFCVDENGNMAGGSGHYWSATLNLKESRCSFVLYFDIAYLGWDYWNSRSHGLSVRPVTE